MQFHPHSGGVRESSVPARRCLANIVKAEGRIAGGVIMTDGVQQPGPAIAVGGGFRDEQRIAPAGIFIADGLEPFCCPRFQFSTLAYSPFSEQTDDHIITEEPASVLQNCLNSSTFLPFLLANWQVFFAPMIRSGTFISFPFNLKGTVFPPGSERQPIRINYGMGRTILQYNRMKR